MASTHYQNCSRRRPQYGAVLQLKWKKTSNFNCFIRNEGDASADVFKNLLFQRLFSIGMKMCRRGVRCIFGSLSVLLYYWRLTLPGRRVASMCESAKLSGMVTSHAIFLLDRQVFSSPVVRPRGSFAEETWARLIALQLSLTCECLCCLAKLRR